MKQVLFIFLLSLNFNSSLLLSMACENAFLTPKQVLNQADPLPKKYESTQEWITQKEDFFKHLRLTNMDDHQAVMKHVEKVSNLLDQHKLNSLNEDRAQNLIFDTGQDTIVRYAGIYNTLTSLASSAGIDSGPRKNMMESVSILKDQHQFKSSVLQAINPNTHIHQHTSMLAYYLMMKKKLQGKKVQPVQTWAVRFDETHEFCDQHYVIVQPKNPDSYQRLDQLTAQERNAIVDKAVLADIAQAVDAGAWCLSADNLWYDIETKTFFITDLEKPNNEGWGPNPGTNPRWGTAVFSYKGDGESCHPWKWRHNIRCGYDAVEDWLNPDLKPEWKKLRAEREPKD